MLQAQQANIIRQLLIELSLGFELTAKVMDWPVFVASEPSDPDNIITVFNTRGTLHGRVFDTGEMVQNYGIQTKVRGRDDAIASAKGRAIMAAYDAILRRPITVNSQALLIQCLTMKSPLLPMGQETKGRRQLYVVNHVVTVNPI